MCLSFLLLWFFPLLFIYLFHYVFCVFLNFMLMYFPQIYYIFLISIMSPFPEIFLNIILLSLSFFFSPIFSISPPNIPPLPPLTPLPSPFPFSHPSSHPFHLPLHSPRPLLICSPPSHYNGSYATPVLKRVLYLPLPDPPAFQIKSGVRASST